MSSEPTQRKLILYMSMSLDGFAARRDGTMDWLGDKQAHGAHRQRAVAELLGQTGLLVLGRRGGEEMAQAWPGSHSFGGASFARSLAAHGLIDEYRINVQPVALGDGLPLLHGLDESLQLELVGSTAWADGPITHTYIPR